MLSDLAVPVDILPKDTPALRLKSLFSQMTRKMQANRSPSSAAFLLCLAAQTDRL